MSLSIAPLLVEFVIFFTMFPQFSRPIHSHLSPNRDPSLFSNSWKSFRPITSSSVTMSTTSRNGLILILPRVRKGSGERTLPQQQPQATSQRQMARKKSRATASHKHRQSHETIQVTTPSQSQGHPVLIKTFRHIAQCLTALPENPPTTSLTITPLNTLHIYVASTLLPSTPNCYATFSVCGPIQSPPPRCHTRHFLSVVRLHCNAVLCSCGLISVSATIATTATATTPTPSSSTPPPPAALPPASSATPATVQPLCPHLFHAVLPERASSKEQKTVVLQSVTEGVPVQCRFNSANAP